MIGLHRKKESRHDATHPRPCPRPGPSPAPSALENPHRAGPGGRRRRLAMASAARAPTPAARRAKPERALERLARWPAGGSARRQRPARRRPP
ncbi:hypothetical protein EBQ25_02225 [Allofranklinella schreckenbergeri]|uniref:Uncharacterized protein n=1 Tax=Allofranklinella schreckenbergeri TaxID=1076744 RepID=A0A3M6QG48_9BURK|nr:hypothetical protein EBQ25_02225 [Allofranklinella schreckenbergeri]